MWRSFSAPSMDLSAEAAGCVCPTLLIWGRHDPVLSAKVAGRRAREALPHARYVELDTGHVPFVEDPPAFLEVLLPFLLGLSLSGARGDDGGVATGAPG